MVNKNPFDNVSFKTAKNIVIYGFILIILTVALLGYQQGKFSGMKEICSPLSVGQDKNQNYICYNKTIKETPQISNNFNFEDLG